MLILREAHSPAPHLMQCITSQGKMAWKTRARSVSAGTRPQRDCNRRIELSQQPRRQQRDGRARGGPTLSDVYVYVHVYMYVYVYVYVYMYVYVYV